MKPSLASPPHCIYFTTQRKTRETGACMCRCRIAAVRLHLLRYSYMLFFGGEVNGKSNCSERKNKQVNKIKGTKTLLYLQVIKFPSDWILWYILLHFWTVKTIYKNGKVISFKWNIQSDFRGNKRIITLSENSFRNMPVIKTALAESLIHFLYIFQ